MAARLKRMARRWGWQSTAVLLVVGYLAFAVGLESGWAALAGFGGADLPQPEYGDRASAETQQAAAAALDAAQNARTLAEAVRSYEQYVQAYPLSPDMMNHLGLLYVRQGRLEQAGRSLRGAAMLAHDHPLGVWVQVSQAYLDACEGDLDGAGQALRQVMAEPVSAGVEDPVQVVPRQFAAPLFLAEVYHRAGRDAEAEALLAQVADRSFALALEWGDADWVPSYLAASYRRWLALADAAQGESLRAELAEKLAVLYQDRNVGAKYSGGQYTVCPPLHGPSYEDEASSLFGSAVAAVVAQVPAPAQGRALGVRSLVLAAELELPEAGHLTSAVSEVVPMIAVTHGTVLRITISVATALRAIAAVRVVRLVAFTGTTTAGM